MSISTSILEQVNGNSTQFTAWALMIAGGTVLTILSASYRRPSQRIWRLPYLLFIPGWVSIAISMYWGDVVVSHFLASLMVDTKQLYDIAQKINGAYDNQRYFLFCSLVFFGIWLLFYLLVWIFNDVVYAGEKK